MKKQKKKEVTTSAHLFAEIRHLHPELKFCGEPKNAILKVPDALLNYVLSLLRNDPIRPPQVSTAQWRKLLHILKSHWITPLLYWHAGQLPDEFQPPAPVMDQMRDVFQWSRARCFRMEKQLREITTAFKAEGVRVLVLKGPAYGRTVYPDPALRPGSDLDLLVLPEAYLKSRGIMERICYKCEFKIFEIFRDFDCEENFSSLTNSKELLPICFHWELHNFFGTERGDIVQAFVKNAAKVESANLSFWVLDPIDALIHAALHLLTHHSEDIRFLWIYDIVLLSQRLEVPEDWKILQDRSAKLGARIAIERVLKLAQIVTDLQIPPSFRDFSLWPKPGETEVTAMAYAMKRYSPSTKLKLRLSSCFRSRQKTKFFFRFILPQPGLMRMTDYYSNGTPLFFCYFRRWGRWAGEIMRFIVNCTHSG